MLIDEERPDPDVPLSGVVAVSVGGQVVMVYGSDGVSAWWMLAEPSPQSLWMLSLAKAREISIRLLLAHLPAGYGRLHVDAGMPGPDRADNGVELRGALGSSEPSRLVLGDPPGGDHLVDLLDDSFPSHQIVASLGAPACAGSLSVSVWYP